MVIPTPETIQLQGGSLALDFANSADWTEDEVIIEEQDVLLEPDSLDRWGERLGVAGRPGGGEELDRARALRRELHTLFSALARDEAPDEATLAQLRDTYAEAVAAGTFALQADGSLQLDWSREDTRRVRFAVVADAVALLADPDRAGRLHRCPGRDCGWVFLDTSGRRRWCSMATCGSREKMRRMYARKRAAGA